MPLTKKYFLEFFLLVVWFCEDESTLCCNDKPYVCYVFIEYNFFCDKLITEARLLDESLDLTEHRAERSSVNKTVREIEKKIGHTSQLSFSDENNWDNFVLTYLNFQGCATQETMLSLIGVCYTVQKKRFNIFWQSNPGDSIFYGTILPTARSSLIEWSWSYIRADEGWGLGVGKYRVYTPPPLTDLFVKNY